MVNANPGFWWNLIIVSYAKSCNHQRNRHATNYRFSSIYCAFRGDSIRFPWLAKPNGAPTICLHCFLGFAMVVWASTDDLVAAPKVGNNGNIAIVMKQRLTIYTNIYTYIYTLVQKYFAIETQCIGLLQILCTLCLGAGIPEQRHPSLCLGSCKAIARDVFHLVARLAWATAMTSAAGSRIGILLTCRKSGLWVEAMSNQASNFEVMSHDTLIGPGAFGSN